jgi:hypothetical protein
LIVAAVTVTSGAKRLGRGQTIAAAKWAPWPSIDSVISRSDNFPRYVSNGGVQRDNSGMQIERNEIRCFHAVVEAGGFSRAAERLDLSQSAVSQAIANLEHRLGAMLLRRGNPPQLTVCRNAHQ